MTPSPSRFKQSPLTNFNFGSKSSTNNHSSKPRNKSTSSIQNYSNNKNQRSKIETINLAADYDDHSTALCLERVVVPTSQTQTTPCFRSQALYKDAYLGRNVGKHVVGESSSSRKEKIDLQMLNHRHVIHISRRSVRVLAVRGNSIKFRTEKGCNTGKGIGILRKERLLCSDCGGNNFGKIMANRTLFQKEVEIVRPNSTSTLYKGDVLIFDRFALVKSVYHYMLVGSKEKKKDAAWWNDPNKNKNDSCTKCCHFVKKVESPVVIDLLDNSSAEERQGLRTAKDKFSLSVPSPLKSAPISTPRKQKSKKACISKSKEANPVICLDDSKPPDNDVIVIDTMPTTVINAAATSTKAKKKPEKLKEIKSPSVTEPFQSSSPASDEYHTPLSTIASTNTTKLDIASSADDKCKLSTSSHDYHKDEAYFTAPSFSDSKIPPPSSSSNPVKQPLTAKAKIEMQTPPACDTSISENEEEYDISTVNPRNAGAMVVKEDTLESKKRGLPIEDDVQESPNKCAKLFKNAHGTKSSNGDTIVEQVSEEFKEQKERNEASSLSNGCGVNDRIYAECYPSKAKCWGVIDVIAKDGTISVKFDDGEYRAGLKRDQYITPREFHVQTNTLPPKLVERETRRHTRRSKAQKTTVPPANGQAFAKGEVICPEVSLTSEGVNHVTSESEEQYWTDMKESNVCQQKPLIHTSLSNLLHRSMMGAEPQTGCQIFEDLYVCGGRVPSPSVASKILNNVLFGPECDGVRFFDSCKHEMVCDYATLIMDVFEEHWNWDMMEKFMEMLSLDNLRSKQSILQIACTLEFLVKFFTSNSARVLEKCSDVRNLLKRIVVSMRTYWKEHSSKGCLIIVNNDFNFFSMNSRLLQAYCDIISLLARTTQRKENLKDKEILFLGLSGINAKDEIHIMLREAILKRELR